MKIKCAKNARKHTQAKRRAKTHINNNTHETTKRNTRTEKCVITTTKQNRV